MKTRRFDVVRLSRNPVAPPPTRSRNAGDRSRELLLVAAMLAACASAALSACATASDDSTSPAAPGPAPIPAPSDDAGAPADADAGAPCTTDCEYFPPACSADVLCPNGLFDLAKPLGGPDEFDGRTTIHLIRGRSERDVWVVGALGALARFDGTSWVRSELPVGPESPLGRPPTLRTLWLRDADEVGVAGFDKVYSRGLAGPADAGVDPDGWTDRGAPTITPKPRFNLTLQTLMSGWAAPGSEWFWLATGSLNRPLVTPAGLVRLRVADSTTFRGDIPVTRVGAFAAVHGASADDVWAVGMNGASLRLTDASGASPTSEAYDTQTRNALYGVWAASASDVWAVGFAGTIRHYVGDPLRWEVVPEIPADVQLNSVWGSSASDVWAVGNDAVVLHYDGTRWSRAKIGGLGSHRPNLTTVWTSGPGHVWVGGDGVVLSLGGKP
jgi:hypothetical protein